MNYYNPYFGFPSALTSSPSVTRGLLRGVLGRGLNWGSILNNTQRTLGIINQAIPVVKQVSPIVNNAKTMFRVMNEFKKMDTPTEPNTVVNNATNTNTENEQTNTNNISDPNINYSTSQGPTFFV